MSDKKRTIGFGWWPAIIMALFLATYVVGTISYNVSRIAAPPNAPPVSN